MSETVKGNARATLVRVAVVLLRLVVGATFAFSGFVKAVDPYGGYYKITEYLMALGLEGLTGVALLAAIALATVEFVLGVMTITGTHRRVVPALMLLFMAVMTPLTLWLALTNAVPDCGCFGDAVKMSNWATFVKNVALVAAIILLLCYNRRVASLYTNAVHWVVPMLSGALALAVSLIGYFVQPAIDYRPFAAGVKIVPDNAEAADEDYRFVYERDGVQQEFSLDSVPDDDEWTYVDRYVAQRAPADSAATVPLAIYDVKTMADVSGDVLTGGDQVLLLFPNLATVSAAHTYWLNRLTDMARRQGATVVALTAATEREIEHWGDISLAEYDMYRADDSTVKMIARGNPAVVFTRGSEVMWKSTLAHIEGPRLDDDVPLESLMNDSDVESWLVKLFYTWLAAMLVLLVLNRGLPALARRAATRHRG